MTPRFPPEKLRRKDTPWNKDTREGTEHTGKFREGFLHQVLHDYAPNLLPKCLCCDLGAGMLPSCWALLEGTMEGDWKPGGDRRACSFLPASWRASAGSLYLHVACVPAALSGPAAMVLPEAAVRRSLRSSAPPCPTSETIVGLGRRPLGHLLKFLRFRNFHFCSRKPRGGSCVSQPSPP